MKTHSLTPWFNWGITTFFVIFQFFLQTSAGVMASHWKMDFHLTALSVANLSAAFFYIYVFMQIPVGLIYDRFSERNILTLAALTLAAGCFLFAYTHNYYIAFIARMIMGIGAAFGFLGMLLVAATWFSSRSFPVIISLGETIGMLAMAAGEILLAWMVLTSGWRLTIAYSGVIALLMSFIILFVVKEKPREPEAYLSKKVVKTSSWITLWQVAKNGQVWLAGMFGFFTFAIINVFTSLWGVPYLRHVYHIDLHTAAKMVSMIFIGVAFGTLLNSWASMKLGRRKPVMIFSSLITALVFSPVIFMPELSHFAIYILLLLTGFFSASYILSFTLAKEIIPTEYRGTALAMVNMLNMISAPILQPLIGLLLTNHVYGLVTNQVELYRITLSILPIGLVIASILCLFMKESFCKGVDNE